MEEVSIFKSKNQEIFFNSEKEFLQSIWYSKENLSEEEHRKAIENYFNKVLELKPKKILVDTINANREISVESQAWIANTQKIKYFESGVKKIAVLLSKNAFLSMSIMQTREEIDDSDVVWETKVFSEKDLALEWLEI